MKACLKWGLHFLDVHRGLFRRLSFDDRISDIVMIAHPYVQGWTLVGMRGKIRYLAYQRSDDGWKLSELSSATMRLKYFKISVRLSEDMTKLDALIEQSFLTLFPEQQRPDELNSISKGMHHKAPDHAILDGLGSKPNQFIDLLSYF